MNKQCDVKYNLSYVRGINTYSEPVQCRRPVYKENKCICHFNSKDKPIEKIIAFIRAMEHHKNIDCSYFVFPESDFIFPIAIKKKIFFDNSIFYGNANFRGQQFTNFASFRSVNFYGEADFGDDSNPYEKQTKFSDTVVFSNTTFHKRTSFRSCIFGKNPEFFGTIFKDILVFAWCKFIYDYPKPILFNNVEFQNNTDFQLEINGEIPGIEFSSCNLEGLNFSTLPKDYIPIIFKDIKKWNEKKKWYHFNRNKINDESDANKNPIILISLYRYLEKYFYTNSDPSLAKDFRIGHLIALRKDKNYNGISKFINFIYDSTSKFGMSIWRPITILLFTLIIFPLALLFSGISIPVVKGKEVQTKDVNYEITNTYPTIELYSEFWSDYRNCFILNISISTLDRNNKFSPLPNSASRIILIVETLIIIIYVSFLVIAVRRKFTPVKPISE